jgi:predicted PurR-regulated permease PerM
LERVPTVHVRGGGAIRRPLTVLAVCAIISIGYVARDFLIPTAAAVVLALLLMPIANFLERLRLPSTLAAALSVLLLTVAIAGLLAIAIPSISSWFQQGPYLTYTLQRKLEGLRNSISFLQELSSKVEQATTATAPNAPQAAEKVVVQQRSLLGELATATPVLVLQIGYTGVLAFMLLAHRGGFRRQILRVPTAFYTRVRLARLMRDINERVGQYLLSLVAIYTGVAVLSAIALALLGFSNVVMWGACMGIASFVPFVGPPAVIGLVTIVGVLSFEDWPRMVAGPAILTVIHFCESQLVTPSFVGRRCALNTVIVFAAIALLGWMWGAVGAIVAVPLLILISTIAAHLPSLRWLEVLLADDRPVSPRLERPRLASVKSPPVKPARTPARQSRRRLVAAK